MPVANHLPATFNYSRHTRRLACYELQPPSFPVWFAYAAFAWHCLFTVPPYPRTPQRPLPYPHRRYIQLFIGYCWLDLLRLLPGYRTRRAAHPTPLHAPHYNPVPTYACICSFSLCYWRVVPFIPCNTTTLRLPRTPLSPVPDACCPAPTTTHCQPCSTYATRRPPPARWPYLPPPARGVACGHACLGAGLWLPSPPCHFPRT